MPTLPSSDADRAADPPTPPITSSGQPTARPTRLHRAWRGARPFLALAAELAGFAVVFYLAGALLIYFLDFRDGDIFQRIVGNTALTDLRAQVISFAILLVAVEYVGIACHELGHALAARLMGYRFGWLRVGGFVVRRTTRGPRLGVSDGALLGGQTHCLPYRGSDMRLRHIVFVLGGPLMSMAFGVVAWLAYARGSGRITDPSSQPLSVALLLFAALSGIGGALNLIPLPGRKMYSDGMLIVRTIRGGPAVTRTLALSGLRGCLERHERPRAWPASLVERALALAELAPDDPRPYLFAYSWALDRGETACAGAYLDALLPHPFGSATEDATIALEAAYYLARYQRDAVAARDWLARGDAAAYRAVLRPRAEAALALLENRPTEALALAEAGLAEVARLASDADSVNVAEVAESLRELATLAHAALAPVARDPASPSM